MSTAGVDQVAAVKASLELMVVENGEVHEFFRNLLERVSELDEAPPSERRSKFKALVGEGAFRFNGLDVRHFTQTQHKPLPPPVFLSRTKRRLKNTQTLLDEFERRGFFDEAELLRDEIEGLAMRIVDDSDGKAVREFKAEVEALRESPIFSSYLKVKSTFIKSDTEIRTEAEYLAAKEAVQDGEEMMRQRGEELEEISQAIESGDMELEDAQARLEAMSLPGEARSETAAAVPEPVVSEGTPLENALDEDAEMGFGDMDEAADEDNEGAPS